VSGRREDLDLASPLVDDLVPGWRWMRLTRRQRREEKRGPRLNELLGLEPATEPATKARSLTRSDGVGILPTERVNASPDEDEHRRETRDPGGAAVEYHQTEDCENTEERESHPCVATPRRHVLSLLRGECEFDAFHRARDEAGRTHESGFDEHKLEIHLYRRGSGAPLSGRASPIYNEKPRIAGLFYGRGARI
jgi:hypothetical protein